jgi:hypothetical protein
VTADCTLCGQWECNHTNQPDIGDNTSLQCGTSVDSANTGARGEGNKTSSTERVGSNSTVTLREDMDSESQRVMRKRSVTRSSSDNGKIKKVTLSKSQRGKSKT